MKPIIKYSLLGLFFLGMGFSYRYYVPKLEKFLLRQVVALGKKYSPMDFKVGEFKLHPYFLGAELKNIELFPKGDAKSITRNIKITSAYGRLSLLGLLRGELRLGLVEINEPELVLFVNMESQGSKSKFEIPLKDILKLPVSQVRIRNLNMTGRLDPQAAVFKVEKLNLDLENRFQTLWVELDAPTTLIKPSGPTPPIELQLELRGSVEEDQIRLSALKVKRKDSYLISSGFFWGEIGKGKITSSDMATRMHLNLETLKDWTSAFAPNLKPPKLSGSLNLDLNSGVKGDKPFLNAEVSTENVIVDKYEIGNLEGEGSYSDSKITAKKIVAKNSGGSVRLNDLSLDLANQWHISGSLEPDVEMGLLLQSIGLKGVPVGMKATGRTSCEGTLKSPIKILCKDAELSGKNLLVHSGGAKRKPIIALDTLSATGSFEFTDTDFKFVSDVKVGTNSVGKSNGTVNFKEGFHIFYEASLLDFADITNLSDLKIEGSGVVKGETKGNASKATMELNGSFEKFKLEDFALGQISSDVKYQDGFLHFKQTNGIFKSTRYSGHLSLNLPESTIYIYFKSPFLDLGDVKEVLAIPLPIPIALSGSGTAEFKANGPLDIKKMNYDVSAQFYRGYLHTESYDSIDFKGVAVDGVLSATNAVLKKGRGEVRLRGNLLPAWSLDIDLAGKDLRLEQSETLSKSGLDIQGVGQFQATIKGDVAGPIREPLKIKIDGQTQKLVVANQAVADSRFSLNFKEQGIEGSASLFADQVKTEFLFPKTEKDPFSLKVSAEKWDVSRIFETLTKAQRTYDFQSSLSVNVDLSSPNGGFWNSTGEISLENFNIRKGSQSLDSNGPMKLIFNKGLINSENFRLSGGENFLRLNVRSATKENLNTQINGKFDLNIFSLFFGFASDVRGLLSLNANLSGPITDPRVTGSAYVDKGYIKAKDFPHPFTDLRSDILFTQKTLFINSIRGEVAGGSISGDGSIRVDSMTSVPIQIQANLNKVSLNFPENYRTKGSVNLALSGSKYPYLVNMKYEVTEAEITSEFGGNGGGTQGVRQSPYLPPNISEVGIPPFFMNLDIAFQNPVRITNTLLQASLTGDLNLKGTSAELIMKGGLTFQPGGLVYFRDVPFEVSTGYIEYNSTTPDNPKIYISASTQVGETVFDDDRRQTERQYDVNMLVQGRGQDPQVTLTSQPPLAQKDIVSLLALGLTQEALDESRTTGVQMTSTSTAIGAALLQRPVGKRLKDRFGVDMKVSSSQASVDNTSSAKVTFSKQWSPKLNMSASGTLEANPKSSVKLEYQLQRGLSVIGSWEGKEQGATQTEERKDVSNSVLGMDLEYKVQFK